MENVSEIITETVVKLRSDRFSKDLCYSKKIGCESEKPFDLRTLILSLW